MTTTGSDVTGAGGRDDRMYVFEVNRLVALDLTEDVMLGDGRPGVMYTHASWSPSGPSGPSGPHGAGTSTLSVIEETRSRPEDGVFWCVLTRENAPEYMPFRVEPFRTRDEAIAHLESVEPRCPLHSLGGEPMRPELPLAEFRAWVRANGWEPSYVAPEPEPDVGVHPLPEPFAIPEEHETLLYWRLAPRMTRPGLEDFILESIRSGGQPVPWAVVILDRSYRLIGRFLCDRGTPAEMVAITVDPPPGRGVVPLLKAIVVYRKAGLASAAERCELFRPAWELLADKPRDGARPRARNSAGVRTRTLATVFPRKGPKSRRSPVTRWVARAPSAAARTGRSLSRSASPSGRTASSCSGTTSRRWTSAWRRRPASTVSRFRRASSMTYSDARRSAPSTSQRSLRRDVSLHAAEKRTLASRNGRARFISAVGSGERRQDRCRAARGPLCGPCGSPPDRRPSRG